MNTVLAPVDDQSLTNAEQHDGDLSNGEETPDGSLLHKVRCDKSSKGGTEDEEENTLNDHTLLFVQSKEGSEHQEGVNGCSWDDVGGIGEGNGPGKVIVSFVCAQLLTSEPLGGGTVFDVEGLGPHSCQQVAREQHGSSNKTKSLDHHVFVKVFLVFGEGCVDDMAEIRLEANVQESSNCQHLIDDGIANGRVKIRSNKEILHGLEQLHCEKEENS